jgi:ABC-2 type transport system permease protein
MLSVTSLFGDYALVGLVKSGDVATELHRPWDWSLYRLGNDLGKSAFAGITRGLAIAVGGWLMFALPAPELRRILMFLITVVLAAVLASRIWTISGIAAFWLVDATGVVQLFVAFAMFTTGLVVPLQILPEVLGAAFGYSPFASLIQRPTDVLLAQRSLAPVVAVQVGWIAVFEIILRLELLAATRRLEVQGG